MTRPHPGSDPRTSGRPAPRAATVALGAAALHVVVALVHIARGVSIRRDFGPVPWEFFWQSIPTADLRERALQSLWALHAQPPLWNALNALLIKALGPAHLTGLHALHVALGAAICAMAVLLARRLTGSTIAAAVAGGLVALDPALVMYEAYALYEVFCAFLILAAVLALARGAPEGATRPLLLALACVTALVLTRSVYHLVVLIAAVGVATAVARSKRLVLVAGLACALLPAGWYAKNLFQYGFFGSSSWYGIGLWRIALFRYDTDELLPLLLDGTFRPVVQLSPFTAPSRYQPLGYRGTSDVPLLARDDFHNVNVPAISADYAASARRLIERDPAHYLGNVAVAFGMFATPSTESDHLVPNRDRMGAHVTLWRGLWGHPLAVRLDRLLPIGTTGSLLSLLLPLGLLGQLLMTLRRSWRGSSAAVLREEAPLLAAAGMIAYTAIVGSAFELGENVRFKFMIEPLLLVWITVLAAQLLRRRAGTGAPQAAISAEAGGLQDPESFAESNAF